MFGDMSRLRDDQADAEEFTNLLDEERPSATVAFLSRASPDVTGELDRIAQSVGFHGLGNRWHELTREEAMQLLIRALQFDLAYSSGEEMTQARAENFATQFINRFSTPGRWFTNGTFTPTGWSGWGKVGNATFETGVAALSDELVGILWVEDED
jgi:hypothetical protein